MIKMGALAADRVNASTLVAGYVIAVVRNGDHLATTRRKTGVLHATVTGKSLTPPADGERTSRYVIHTDKGDTLPVPGIQTFPLIAAPGEASGAAPAVESPAAPSVLCGCGTTMPAGTGDAAGIACTHCGTNIPLPDCTDGPTLWRAYERAVELMAMADVPATERTDKRARVETFRGRKLRTEKGARWGEIVTRINGQVVGTPIGSGPEALNIHAAGLRRDVIAADERRVTNPDAYPEYYYQGAPAQLPTAVVLHLRHLAAEDAARRALECHDSGHVPGVMGCASTSRDCDGIPADAATIKAEPIPAAGATGFGEMGLELHAQLSRQLADVGPMCAGETYWDHKPVRRVAIWETMVGAHLVIVVSYEGRVYPSDRASYAAVEIDGRLIEDAGAIPLAQRPGVLTARLAWVIAEAVRKLDAETPAVETPAEVPAPAVEGGDQGDAPAVPTIDGVPAGMPYVVRMPEGWQGATPVRIEPKAIAKIIRSEFLPAWFPGVKFSVRIDSGSMYSAVDISWTDGPSDSAVALVAEQWRGVDWSDETTHYTGSVLYVNRAGEVTAYDLAGVSIGRHRDVSPAGIDAARPFLAGVDPDTIARHSGYHSPYGQPWYGGSVDDCARWLATCGVDRDVRDVRSTGPLPDVCPVRLCDLVDGHRWPTIHRDLFGRAFFATLPDGDQGDGGSGGGEPTTPGPDDTPAPAGETFRTWEQLAQHITGGRFPFAEAPAGDQVDRVDTGTAWRMAPGGWFTCDGCGQKRMDPCGGAMQSTDGARTLCRDCFAEQRAQIWDKRPDGVYGVAVNGEFAGAVRHVQANPHAFESDGADRTHCGVAHGSAKCGRLASSPIHADAGDQVEGPAVAPAPVPDRKLLVINDGRGSIRVHAESCADTRREVAAGGSGWNVTVPDLRGVVFDIYGNGDFEDFTPDSWRDWAGDITVLPCVGDLPESAGTDTPAPAGEPMPAAVRPEVGEVVTVHGWQVRPFVVAIRPEQGRALLWSSGETSRVPLDMITGAEVLPGDQVRDFAAAVLAEPHPVAADEHMPAFAALAPWTSGRPLPGQLVTAVALNDTAGVRRETPQLIARRVTNLGCGCYRIECLRPGPVHGAPYEPRSWVKPAHRVRRPA
jgi:hypothetical protein